MDFCQLQEIFKQIQKRKSINTATKTELDALKTASKKVAHRAAKATEEFIGNILAGKIVKTKPGPDEKLKSFEEMVIPPEKRGGILNKLRQLL